MQSDGEGDISSINDSKLHLRVLTVVRYILKLFLIINNNPNIQLEGYS